MADDDIRATVQQRFYWQHSVSHCRWELVAPDPAGVREPQIVLWVTDEMTQRADRPTVERIIAQKVMGGPPLPDEAF